MGKGGVEREGCDQREMSEQRPPPGSHLPCPVKSLPSCAPGCSLLPLGPGSLLPPRRPGWEKPLSLLVVSLPCWTCFSCPAGTASSTETHPGCGMGSPAGFFFRGKGNKIEICLNPGDRSRTEISVSLSSLVSEPQAGSEDPQGASAGSRAVTRQRRLLRAQPAPRGAGKGLIWRGDSVLRQRRGLCDPHRPAQRSPLKSKTQRGSRGAESSAPSRACCRPPIHPGASPALPGHPPNFAFKGKQRASASQPCEESCYCPGLFSLSEPLRGGTCQCLPWQRSKAQAGDALRSWHPFANCLNELLTHHHQKYLLFRGFSALASGGQRPPPTCQGQPSPRSCLPSSTPWHQGRGAGSDPTGTGGQGRSRRLLLASRLAGANGPAPHVHRVRSRVSAESWGGELNDLASPPQPQQGRVRVMGGTTPGCARSAAGTRAAARQPGKSAASDGGASLGLLAVGLGRFWPARP